MTNREEFEKWMKKQKSNYQPTDDSLTDRAYWTVWQGCAQHYEAKVAELEKEIAHLKSTFGSY